jgi:hypothetical protein
MLAHGLFPGGAHCLGFFVITASALLLFALLWLIGSLGFCFKCLEKAYWRKTLVPPPETRALLAFN